jgi:hypothetical protein
MTQRTYQAIVHKANVPLMKGESLGQFTHQLRKQAQPMLLQKFNTDEKKGGAWPLEVYSNKAVFMVAPEWADISKDLTVAFSYERDEATGDFKFGDVQKVKAIVSYEVSKRVELPVAMEMPNWTPDTEAPPVETAKSFWHGVV